jgi:hypothetical protein
MWEQAEMEAHRVTLAQVWRLWRKVLAARKVLVDLEVKVDRPERKYFEDNYGKDPFEIYVGTARQRAEAQAARDRAEGLYDVVLRVFEGRFPRTHVRACGISQQVENCAPSE